MKKNKRCGMGIRGILLLAIIMNLFSAVVFAEPLAEADTFTFAGMQAEEASPVGANPIGVSSVETDPAGLSQEEVNQVEANPEEVSQEKGTKQAGEREDNTASDSEGEAYSSEVLPVETFPIGGLLGIGENGLEAARSLHARSGTGIEINATNFPDASFRTWLSSSLRDSDGDGWLSAAEINSITRFVVPTTVADLTGVKLLTNLDYLSCSNNPNITIIDVAGMSSLTEVRYSRNPNLTTLDFRNCLNLVIGWHSENGETVYISAGMTQYVGCNIVPNHTGNVVIDLEGLYTVHPDGRKTIDLSTVVSPAFLGVLAQNSAVNTMYDVATTTLTILPGEAVTTVQAGRTSGGPLGIQATFWTFYTQITTVTDRVVTFDTQGGSIIAAQVIRDGTLASIPTPPTRDGHEFVGWYTEATYDNLFDFTTPVNADIRLYASWNPLPNNQKPIILAQDQILQIGDTFNPNVGVTASDAEDGDLTNEIVISGNNVDTSTAGVYRVTYQVQDSDGAMAELSIAVTVEAKSIPPTNQTPVNPTTVDQTPEKTNTLTQGGKETPSNVPKTGDTSNMLGLTLGMISLSGIIIATLIYKRKKSN